MARRFIAQATADGSAELIIFDEIGDSFFGEGVTAKSVNQQLKAFGDVDTITVRINSPGGAVFDGLAIYNLLVQHPARIVVEIDGLAASAASVIAMAGDVIRMAKNALMMVHPAQSMAMGDADDMRSQADILDKITENIIDIYTARSGRSREAIAALVDNDTWLTADEALGAGLITDITADKDIAAKAVGFLQNIGKLPLNAVNRLVELAQDTPIRISKAELLEEIAKIDTPAHTERKQPNNNQGTQMEMLKALGYANEAEASAALVDLQQYQTGVVSATGASGPLDAVQRITTMKAELDVANAAILTAKAEAETVQVEAQITALTKDMKLAPAQHDWFRTMTSSQRDAFSASAPVLVKASAAAPRPIEADKVTLTADQKKMAELTGVDPEAYAAQVAIDNKKEAV